MHDLFAYGFRGQQTPEVKAAIAEFFKEGFQFFQAPTDLAAMAAGARPIVEAAAKIQPAR